MSSLSWLEGLNLENQEDFLAEAAEGLPTASELNPRYVLHVENAYFRKAPETYTAKIQNHSGGPIIQICFEGSIMGSGKQLKEPRAFTIGSGWELDNNGDGDTAEKVKSSEYSKFSGASGYGKIIRNICERFGINAENEESFMQINPKTNDPFKFGPEVQRFFRFFAARNKAIPKWNDATIWNGVYLQMDGEEFKDKNGNVKNQTVVAGLVGFEGEKKEEFEWYKNLVESTGGNLPWYVLAPGQSLEERDGKAEKHNSDKAATTENKSAAEAKSEPAATKPSSNGKPSNEEMIAELTELAVSVDSFSTFKQKAAVIAKKNPLWIPWVMREPNFEALKSGEASPPVAK